MNNQILTGWIMILIIINMSIWIPMFVGWMWDDKRVI